MNCWSGEKTRYKMTSFSASEDHAPGDSCHPPSLSQAKVRQCICDLVALVQRHEINMIYKVITYKITYFFYLRYIKWQIFHINFCRFTYIFFTSMMLQSLMKIKVFVPVQHRQLQGCFCFYKFLKQLHPLLLWFISLHTLMSEDADATVIKNEVN